MTFYETVRAKASEAPRELVKLDRIMRDEMLADNFLNDAWLRLPTQGEK